MKKHLSFKLASLLMMLCMLLSSGVVSAYALDTPSDKAAGTINIVTAESCKGVTLSLYEVGTYSYTTSEVTLNDQFKDCKLETNKLTEAKTTKAAAAALSDYAFDHYYEGKDVRIDDKGNAVFTGLDTDHKVYLVAQTSDFHFATVTPVLVVLPYRYEGAAEFVNNVSVTAKFVDDMDKYYKGALIVHKVDDKDAVLEGAEFRLERKIYYTTAPDDIDLYDQGSDEDGDFYWYIIVDGLVTNAKGQAAVKNLPFLSYRLVETKAPDGYIMDSEPHEFTIDNYAEIQLKDETYAVTEGEAVTMKVVNTPETSEPSEPSTPDSSTPESDGSSSEVSVPESSVTPSTPEKSTPEVSKPETSVPQSSTPGIFTFTGDEIGKYIIIGAIVLVSLVVVILLFVITGKKNKKK